MLAAPGALIVVINDGWEVTPIFGPIIKTIPIGQLLHAEQAGGDAAFHVHVVVAEEFEFHADDATRVDFKLVGERPAVAVNHRGLAVSRRTSADEPAVLVADS